MLWYFLSVPGSGRLPHGASPCLEVGDDVFDGGSDFAQRDVELGLGGGEVATGESLGRDGVDALDAEIAQVVTVDRSASRAARAETSKA